jgi:hypothetical protein
VHIAGSNDPGQSGLAYDSIGHLHAYARSFFTTIGHVDRIEVDSE